MKKLIFCFLMLMAVAAPAATVRYVSTNVFGLPDTNVLRVTPIGAPIKADGSFVTRGAPWRWYPDATGTAMTNLMQGNYLVSNNVLNTNIIFAVPVDSDTNNIYDIGGVSGLAISGFNTYNYSPGIRTLTGTSIEVTNDGYGHFYITETNLTSLTAEDVSGVTNSSGTIKAGRFNIGSSQIDSWDDVTNYFTQIGGSGSQTPVLQDIDYAGKSATNLNNLEVTNLFTLRTAHVTNWNFYGTIGVGNFLAVSNSIVVLTNAPSGGGSGGGTGSAFELDANGDTMPSLVDGSDTLWEYDGDGDLQPTL